MAKKEKFGMLLEQIFTVEDEKTLQAYCEKFKVSDKMLNDGEKFADLLEAGKIQKNENELGYISHSEALELMANQNTQKEQSSQSQQAKTYERLKADDERYEDLRVYREKGKEVPGENGEPKTLKGDIVLKGTGIKQNKEVRDFLKYAMKINYNAQKGGYVIEDPYGTKSDADVKAMYKQLKAKVTNWNRANDAKELSNENKDDAQLRKEYIHSRLIAEEGFNKPYYDKILNANQDKNIDALKQFANEMKDLSDNLDKLGYLTQHQSGKLIFKSNEVAQIFIDNIGADEKTLANAINVFDKSQAQEQEQKAETKEENKDQEKAQSKFKRNRNR
jgi:hypothetical protein